MPMAKKRDRRKSPTARSKPVREAAALKALRAALVDFADVEIVAPAVKPKGAGTQRAIRKAVREFYQDRKMLERT